MQDTLMHILLWAMRVPSGIGGCPRPCSNTMETAIFKIYFVLSQYVWDDIDNHETPQMTFPYASV